MKASIEEINSVQKRLKITVSPELVNKAFDTAYLRLKQKANIQGFRPGKAPLPMIKKIYGASVSSEVGEQLINDHLFEAIKEQGFKPIASPFVEANSLPHTDEAYHFSAVVDLMPQITLEGQHKGLVVHCKEHVRDNDSIQREMERLRAENARLTSLEPGTAAAHGHLAMVSQHVDADGQCLHHLEQRSTPFHLGVDKFDFPELEAGILGLKKGEDKKVSVTLPADFEDKSLAGKEVQFHLTLNDLQGVSLPEINDEFAKDLQFESLEQLKDAVNSNLDASITQTNKQELEKSLLAVLAAKVPFDVPPAMVDQVIDSIISEINFKSKDDLRQALKDADIRKRFRGEAKLKAHNTLLLWEVVKQENLSVSDAEINEHIRQFVKEGQGDQEKQIALTFKQFGERIRENLLFEKAMSTLAESAILSKTPTPY